MPDKYYDVIVIGRSLGALVAAALLARRDFTVLVIGQGRKPADYEVSGRTLRRRGFTMLAAGSPVWRRVVGELAQTQTWKRRVLPVEPMMQVLMPGKCFDIPPDAALFAREVEREFPEVRRLITELYSDFARVTAAADAGFDKDAVWPPGTFMERRETGRVASTLPYARAEPHADLLAEFPRRHPYRRIVTESVRFASDLAPRPPAFASARLHGAWARGLVTLEGGELELETMLLDRVRANGGECLMAERVESIEVKRGTVSGVYLDGETNPLGAGFVITDMTGEEIAALAGGQGISKKAQREWPRIVPTTARYVVSLLVRSEGVPVPLGREVFLFGESGEDGGAVPTIHLQRGRGDSDGETLLVAEMLRSEREALAMADARASLVDSLIRRLPFLERHLLLVDSVHDGLPVWCFDESLIEGDTTMRTEGTGRLPRFAPRPIELERTLVDGAPSRAEPMEKQLEVDPPGYLGVAGEPIRGPIERTLLVGSSVLPGLGQEGRVLAAVGAARLVTQSDRRKARMRREMWTKIEIS